MQQRSRFRVGEPQIPEAQLGKLPVPRPWVDVATNITAGEAPASTLAPGEIAIIGYNADTPDAFAFVALRGLADGTAIRFTDNGWYAAGGFRSSEGIVLWTNDTGSTHAEHVAGR